VQLNARRITGNNQIGVRPQFDLGGGFGALGGGGFGFALVALDQLLCADV